MQHKFWINFPEQLMSLYKYDQLTSRQTYKITYFCSYV